MDFFKIYNAQIVDLSLKIDDYLVISDLHLGYEEALNSQGIMLPKFQYPLIIERLQEIISKNPTENIIINGDLKHEFGIISRQEWSETQNFIEFVKAKFQEIVLIKGNHDPLTPVIARKNGLEFHERFSIGDFTVMHGDLIPYDWKKIREETIIIGHEHPTVGIRSYERVEKIKCFLKGSYDNKNLIVMPSFNFVTEGSDILNEKPLSPFLAHIEDWNVYGVENFEVFYFGKTNDLLKFQEQGPWEKE
jgi:putative SbcD/Mre11-related phosphoesterase